jgi:outer membrane biosynthesis protein TonB
MTSDELNWRFIHTPKIFLYLSLALHLCIPLFFGTVTLLDKLGWSLLGPKTPQKEIYQEFIQVDMVGLPDQLLGDQNDVDTSLPIDEKTVPPTKAEEPAPTPAPEEGAEKGKSQEDIMAEAEAQAKKEAEAAKAKAEKERKEAERVAREKALKQIEAETRREAALKELAAKGTRGKLKGNLLSKGTSSKGLIGTAKDAYISLIAKKVKEHFNIYAHHKKRALVGTVFILLDARGNLKEYRIVKPSKDSTFDSALLLGVKEAAPLPVPNDDSVLREGITIEFRADE